MGRDWGDDVLEGILCLILSSLFGKDRHSFSLVCKRWNKAAKFSPFGEYSPCLMNYERSNCAWKLYHYSGSVWMALPQFLNGAEIRCAKHGWMLMSKATDLTMFFYDPFNKETIHLPKPDSKYTVVCFFHPPTSRDCFVVGAETVCELTTHDMMWKLSNDVKIGVVRRGENVWSERVYQGESPFILSLCTPVLHQRLIHFLDLEGNIGTFDVGSPGGRWTVLPECLLPPKIPGRIVQYFLIELRDEQPGLLSVLVTHEKVNVFRMLFSGPRTWAPVEDLEDKVLFLSRNACFAATAPWQSMANRIYFSKTTCGDDDVIVFYCLASGRYRSCKGDFSSKESYRLPDLNFATWIVATPTTPEFPRDLTWCHWWSPKNWLGRAKKLYFGWARLVPTFLRGLIKILFTRPIF